jgi:hypothetical protein
MPSRSLPVPSETVRQLALPLDKPSGPIAPPVAIAHVRPERILATLSLGMRQQIRQTWVRVFREVVHDGSGD